MENSQNNTNTQAEESQKDQNSKGQKQAPNNYYKIQFRKSGSIFSGASRIPNLKPDEIIMAQTDHGLEPARIVWPSTRLDLDEGKDVPASYIVSRRANREEVSKYQRLMEREQEAFEICQKYIAKHHLAMRLTRVERFFNGSKIIFYFTAENRVDFRELVKDLVQEFRTRVEIRQIGVRHETKMLGGIGCCGRELCCSTFINNFAPVSIKMAKEQDLPLNPSKISGVCNRLLCCLTYEFDNYHKMRREMPKPGKKLTFEGREYKVMQTNIMSRTVTVSPLDDPEVNIILDKEQWSKADYPRPKAQEKSRKKGKRQQQSPENPKADKNKNGNKPEDND